MRLIPCFIVLCALLNACSSLHMAQSPALYTRSELLDGHLLSIDAQPLPAVDILAVNDDMRVFLRQHVPPNASDARKTELILAALLKNGLDLSYDTFKTYTATEAFYRKTANCLSFTSLFIALAREAGVNVRFQQVEVPPSWAQRDGLLAFNLHINALVTARGHKRVVDFNMEEFDNRYRRHVISDNIARSQYHNNMSMNALMRDDITQAFLHLRQAIQLDPNSGYFWNNLGALYRKRNNAEASASAFTIAVNISNEPVAMSNLARHYRRTGNQTLAVYYEQKVERFRRKNPFYLYELAVTQYNDAHYLEAKNLLQRAIKLERNQHHFYRLLGLSDLQLGDAKSGTRHIRQAFDLAENADDKNRYSRKLELLHGRR